MHHQKVRRWLAFSQAMMVLTEAIADGATVAKQSFADSAMIPFVYLPKTGILAEPTDPV